MLGALVLAVWLLGVSGFLAAVAYALAAACQLRPEKKSQYSWNPLNGILRASNLTDKGRAFRTRALYSLVSAAGALGVLFLMKFVSELG